jgi:hypothetical protein
MLAIVCPVLIFNPSFDVTQTLREATDDIYIASFRYETEVRSQLHTLVKLPHQERLVSKLSSYTFDDGSLIHGRGKGFFFFAPTRST